MGDWCFFRAENTSHQNSTDHSVYVGLILAFKFAQGNSEREKHFKSDAVDLNSYPDLENQLQVLASWHQVNDRAQLISAVRENHIFLDLKNYIATVVKPNVDPDTNNLHFIENSFDEIESAVLKIINK